MTWSVPRGRGSTGTGRDLGFSSAVLTNAGVEKAVVPDFIIVVLGVVRRDILCLKIVLPMLIGSVLLDSWMGVLLIGCTGVVVLGLGLVVLKVVVVDVLVEAVEETGLRRAFFKIRKRPTFFLFLFVFEPKLEVEFFVAAA